MRKHLVVMMCIIMAVCLIPAVAMATVEPPALNQRVTETTGFWDDFVKVAPEGYAENGDIITISNEDALAWFGKEINNGKSYAGKTVNIENNLDMSAHYWTPIDTQTLTGTTGVKEPTKKLNGARIDGKGHIVSGLNTKTGIRGPKNDSVPGDGQNCFYYAGFIGRNDGELTICDLTFDSADIAILEPEEVLINGSSSLAVVAGLNSGILRLQNVDINGSKVTAMQKAGGFVGQDAGSLYVTHCSVIDSIFDAYYFAAPIDAYAMKTQYSYQLENRKNTLSMNGIKLNGNQIVQRRDEGVTYKTITNGGTYSDIWLNGSGYWYLNWCDTAFVAGDVIYTSVADDNTKYVSYPLNFVASVNGYQYTSLSEAIAAANSGDTITLLRDCETTDGYSLTSPLCLTASDVTLDLNGKTLTVTNNFSFVINGDSDVVKNGTIQAGSNSGKHTGINSYALVLNGCDGVVVENVTSHGGISVGGSTGETPGAAAATNAIIKNCNVTSGDYYAICAQQNSTVTIESGIYTADTRSAIAGVLQGTFIGADGPKGTITVTGGTFNGAIKKNNNGDLVFKGGTFSIDPTEYKSQVGCYTVVENNVEPKTWTVIADHDWNEGVVTKEPTYDTTGEKTYTCTVGGCGTTRTEIIPKKNRPSIPTTPTDNVTNSGSTGTDNAATNADLSNTTATSNGTTTATVDKTTADKIVDKAVENKSTEVVIDATANTTTAADSTTIAQVTIPTETLGAIAEKTEADVTIKTDVAEVKMDNAAATAVSEQATGDTVQIIAEKVAEETDKVEFELKVVCSDGKVISDFKGGNVAVTVALPKAMAEKKVVCVYIDDNGHMSKMEGKKNADGTYTFNTGHFSSYAILTEEEADAAIEAQKEAIRNIKIKLRSELVETKYGKKAVKVNWTVIEGNKKLDGVEIYRSTERYKGYGNKPFYTSAKGGKSGSYINTKSLENGIRYYYKVRGYILVDGQKVYTDYSTKAWRTVR